MRRHISWLTAVVSTLALLAGVPTTASAAGPPAPVIVSPDGDTVQSTPVLTWNRATGAVKYEVTVSAAADFSGTAAFIQTTANVHATPLKDLPVGDWYWRVRGLDSTGMAGPYDTATFTRALDASPVLTSPVDAKTLKYPNEALSYQWEPFAGAKTYELQVDDDPAFIGAAAAISTPNTSYSPTNSPAFDTPVYWRVRAKSANNVYSQWSEPFTYTITWDPATTVTLVGPPSSNSVPVEKVVLTWEPVRGAAFYQLDLSPDQNFNSPIYDDAKVVGNTFVPKTTLVAGAYYWRVRPMSSSITPEPGEWSDTGAGPWTFTKAWPASAPTSPRPQGTEDNRLAQVTLRSPANGDFTLARPTFSWSPQRNASHYEVQVGSDANFSPSTFNTCTTNHTTFTPYASCMPAYISPGVVRYWRVRAVDGVAASPAVYGAFSEVRSYLYDPAHIVQSSPAPGATVMTPVLRWSAVPNIARYKVTITGSAVGCAVSITAFVWNTTYVPETLRRDCTGPFSWTVQGVEDDGALTRLADAASWPTFTTEPEPFTASEPSPVVATPEAAFRPPLLDWPRVTGADGYQVYASVAGANSYTPLGAKTNQTMFAYTGVSTGGFGALLPPGDYDYYVRALNGATQLEPSPRGTFHIAPMPVTQLTAPADCPQGSCTAVEYDTPTFEWAPVAGAGYYLVYLATDPLFTNITKTYTTPFNSLRPMESLPDSQAGQATYWFVRPCYTAANCGPFDESVFGQARAFRKVSRPVEDLAAATPNPAPSATPVDNSVLFTWKDYLVTNTTGTPAVEQEAAYYQLQVSTTANFTSVIDTVSTLDQTAYLAPTLTYPDGPLYARIRAWDRTGNPLTWGDPISFTKSSPPPSGLTPMAGASVTGTPLLQWTPMASAQQYDVEIYRNPSSPISPTNLVTTIRTRLTTAALATALPAGQSYGWRVRRLDASSQASSWSALATFTVTGPAPVLTSPPNGTAVNSNALLFSWSAQARATRYKIDASTSSTFSSLIETATTDMTAWAPGLISPAWPNGTIYWRVSSLDTNNVVSGTSQTWSFTRDASTAGEFTAVTPYRAVDTRTSGGMIGAGQTRTVALTGGGTGIPTSGVTTVVVNVTVTGRPRGRTSRCSPTGPRARPCRRSTSPPGRPWRTTPRFRSTPPDRRTTTTPPARPTSSSTSWATTPGEHSRGPPATPGRTCRPDSSTPAASTAPAPRHCTPVRAVSWRSRVWAECRPTRPLSS